MDLVSLYQDMNYQDEVLKELKEVLRCARKAGRAPGESPKNYADRILNLEDVVARKEKDVADQLDKFEVKSAGMPVFPKAATAWQEFGLPGKALTILLSSEVASFGREGMAMELELLLHTGRMKEVREWPDAAGARDYLGASPYLEVQVQLEAASGDYQKARDDLEEMIEDIHSIKDPEGGILPVRGAMCVSVAQTVLQAQPQDGYQPFLFRTSFFYPTIMQNIGRMTAGLRREADLTTLHGLLALESGEIDQARKDFHDALAVGADEALDRIDGALDFPARPIARDCEKMLDKAAAGR
jgi:tetratricopeptide (TPR) repeat protein